MTYTLSQRRELLGKLPNILQEAILSFENMEAIQKVAEAHRLHIDQATELDDEVNLVMLGLTPLEKFPKNLVGRLQVSEREAEAIATEIDAHVLQKIKKELMEATASPHVQTAMENESTASGGLSEPREIPEEHVSREQALRELETPPSARVRQPLPEPMVVPPRAPHPNLPGIKPEQELVLPKDSPPAWLLEQFKETSGASQTISGIAPVAVQTKTPAQTPPTQFENPLRKSPMPEVAKPATAEPIPGTPALSKLNSIQQTPRVSVNLRPAEKKPPTSYNTDPYREPIE